MGVFKGAEFKNGINSGLRPFFHWVLSWFFYGVSLIWQMVVGWIFRNIHPWLTRLLSSIHIRQTQIKLTSIYWFELGLHKKFPVYHTSTLIPNLSRSNPIGCLFLPPNDKRGLVLYCFDDVLTLHISLIISIDLIIIIKSKIIPDQMGVDDVLLLLHKVSHCRQKGCR